MRDLAEARELSLADIGDAVGGERLKIRLHDVEGVARAGNDGAELADLDGLAVAAHGRSEKRRAALLDPCADVGGFVGADA